MSPAAFFSRTRLSDSSDTRLLLAGVAAFLALVAYLAVAFARTHASASATTSPASAASVANEFAPWVPKYHSTLAHVPLESGGGIAVHVATRWIGNYGAVVPTLVFQPPPRSKIVVGLRLRGPGDTPIQVVVDEFPAGRSPVLINRMVPATARWRHFTFRAHVEGRWEGLGMFVGRETNGVVGRWFAVRDLSVQVLR